MILGMTLSTFTLVHVLLSLVGIGTGLIVVHGLLNGKRLDRWTATFLLTTANQCDRLPVSVRAFSAVSCDRHHFAGGARPRNPGALRASSWRCLALDLRCLRRACSLSERFRWSGADFSEGTPCACVGSDAEGAAIPDRSTRSPGDVHHPRHFRGQEISRLCLIGRRQSLLHSALEFSKAAIFTRQLRLRNRATLGFS